MIMMTDSPVIDLPPPSIYIHALILPDSRLHSETSYPGLVPVETSQCPLPRGSSAPFEMPFGLLIGQSATETISDSHDVIRSGRKERDGGVKSRFWGS